MLAVWQDVCIIHEFHHLSGHCLSLCDWQRGKSFFINLCCVFPLIFRQLMSLAFFFPSFNGPRFHQRHAFHVDSSGTEPSWGDNDTTLSTRKAPPLAASQGAPERPEGRADAQRSEGEGGNDAWSKKQKMNFTDGVGYVVMICNFLSLGDCGLLYLLDSIWHSCSILHQIGIWFIDKSHDVKTCLLQVMPLISNDFNDQTARSSKRFEDSRSARPASPFSRNFFGIEFWGARLGDGIASGAPGDQKSSGRRGWEALGAVIPRVGGHRGAALNQWDKSWILTRDVISSR